MRALICCVLVLSLDACEAPLQPPPERGAIVYGIVTTDSGDPLGGVVLKVQLDPIGCPATESAFSLSLPAEVTSGPEGRYRAEPSFHYDVDQTCVWVQVISPADAIPDSFSGGPVGTREVGLALDSLEVNLEVDLS